VLVTTARLLLLPLPVVGGAYVVALTAGLARARPDLVWWLAPWPLLAAVLAVRAKAWWIVAGAVVELAAAVSLHGLLTFVRAWRLEGG
jgi:hypothetical protein